LLFSDDTLDPCHDAFRHPQGIPVLILPHLFVSAWIPCRNGEVRESDGVGDIDRDAEIRGKLLDEGLKIVSRRGRDTSRHKDRLETFLSGLLGVKAESLEERIGIGTPPPDMT